MFKSARCSRYGFSNMRVVSHAFYVLLLSRRSFAFVRSLFEARSVLCPVLLHSGEQNFPQQTAGIVAFAPRD